MNQEENNKKEENNLKNLHINETEIKYLRKLKIFTYSLGVVLVVTIILCFITPSQIPTNKITIVQASCDYDDPYKPCNKTEEIDFMQYPDRNITKEEITYDFLEDKCKELKEDVWSCKRYLVRIGE